MALTLTPMMCSRLLKSHADQRKTHGRLFNFAERTFDGALHGYERSLAWVMRRRPLALAFSAIILALTAALWSVIPKGLFPPDDTGSLTATAEAPQGTTFVEMLRFGKLAAAKLATDTNVASYTVNVGGMGSSNQIQYNITLKPAGHRPPADEMVHELTRVMSGIPSVQIFVTNPPAIRIGGRGTKTSYQYTCTDRTSPSSTTRAAVS